MAERVAEVEEAVSPTLLRMSDSSISQFSKNAHFDLGMSDWHDNANDENISSRANSLESSDPPAEKRQRFTGSAINRFKDVVTPSELQDLSK